MIIYSYMLGRFIIPSNIIHKSPLTLFASSGSLMSLAKYPASTVQILGAEKALFRALKTKRDTPKYGLIYHAQLIGQASAKYKGKVC